MEKEKIATEIRQAVERLNELIILANDLQIGVSIGQHIFSSSKEFRGKVFVNISVTEYL